MSIFIMQSNLTMSEHSPVRLGNRTITVNLRIYPIVGVNQRSMRVWHAVGL